MDIEKARQEINTLCDELNWHNYRYYVLDDPTIDDREYDLMLRDRKSTRLNSSHL